MIKISHTKETVLSQGNLSSFVHLRDSNLSQSRNRHNLHSSMVNLEKAMEKRKIKDVFTFMILTGQIYFSLWMIVFQSFCSRRKQLNNKYPDKGTGAETPQLSCQTKPCFIKSWTKILAQICICGVSKPYMRSFFPHPTHYVEHMYPKFFLYSNIVS